MIPYYILFLSTWVWRSYVLPIYKVTELESQPRLVQTPAYAQCLHTALWKTIQRPITAFLLAGLLLSHPDPVLLLIPSLAWEVAVSKMQVSQDRKVNIFSWIHVSETIFQKYIMTTSTSHKIPSLGHANMTLKRMSDLSHCKCSIKSIDGSHQHIQQRKKNLDTFLRNGSHRRE